MYIYTQTYIHSESERERERESLSLSLSLSVSLYIIYLHATPGRRLLSPKQNVKQATRAKWHLAFQQAVGDCHDRLKSQQNRVAMS